MAVVLALDVGDKRIGVARSDPLGITAQPLMTYVRKNREADVAHIAALARESGATAVVLGLPRNMDGSLGDQARRTIAFARHLADAGLCALFIDERLTSAAARRTLIEGGVRREKRRQVIDKLAAAEILRTYLGAPERARAWEDFT